MNDKIGSAKMTTVATVLDIPYSTLHGMSKRELLNTETVEGDLHVMLDEDLKSAIENYSPRGNTPIGKEVDMHYFIASEWEEDHLINVAEWKSQALSFSFLQDLYGVSNGLLMQVSEMHLTEYDDDDYIEVHPNAFAEIFDLIDGGYKQVKEEGTSFWESFWEYLPFGTFAFILIATLIYFLLVS